MGERRAGAAQQRDAQPAFEAEGAEPQAPVLQQEAAVRVPALVREQAAVPVLQQELEEAVEVSVPEREREEAVDELVPEREQQPEPA